MPRTVRPDWLSFAEEPEGDQDLLRERPDLIEEGRFSLDDDPTDDPTGTR